MEFTNVPQQINDIPQDNLQKLAQLFPSAVKDGKLDVEALKEELGSFEEVGKEKYELNWAGKQSAKKVAQQDVFGKTLKFCPEKSKDADTTKNIYIEGDNLEALKLLRQNYYGSIKVIYIDPPYNTGKDFVYKDNFSLSQLESDIAEGNIGDTGERYTVNQKSSNKYHANWCNMLYPRLKLAKDLLTDDGAIFISIDDNELDNLIRIGNEIFGEENKVCVIPRLTSAQRPSQEKYISIQHDYVVVFTKSSSMNNGFVRTIERDGSKEIKCDNIGHYIDGDTSPILASATQGYSKGGDYDFEYDGIVYSPIAKDGVRRRWLWTIDRMKAAADLRILVPTKNGLRVRNYIDKEFQTKTNIMVDKNPNLIFASYDFMNAKFANNHGTSEVNSLGLYFDFSKPVDLIKEIVKLNEGDDFYVLDFFAGSSTTAQAVMDLNNEDNGKRKFILVQLPEDLDKNLKEAEQGSKETIRKLIKICDELNVTHYITNVSEERVRRAGEKIKSESPLCVSDLDVGFKVFEVADTNIKWNALEIKDEQIDINTLTNSPDQADFMPNTKDIDVVYEIILRQKNVSLSEKVEVLSDIGSRTYLYADSYLICLETEITNRIIDKLAALEPTPFKYIFRDSAFKDDINLKTDAFRRLKAMVEKNSGLSKKAYTVEFI